MAKTDLLKQAIADANVVKETALANAKIALQEAFAPRIQSMLSAKLSEELEDEEGEDQNLDMDLGADAEAGEGEEALDLDAGTDVGNLSIDVDHDGEFDEFDIMSREPAAEEPAAEEPAAEDEMSDEEMDAEYNEGEDHEEDDLELESIIRELEGDLDDDHENENLANPMIDEADENEMDAELDESIDSIIEAILREEEDAEEPVSDVAELKHEIAKKDEELQEAYNTVKQLNSIINEVNLLNAKLLYTNKLFRNFDLNESQKMKVIENFDRAGNTREVKLVFSTLAESFTQPTIKKRVVKESLASKATQTTAPNPETTKILSEGFELADRWKKLAGLL